MLTPLVSSLTNPIPALQPAAWFRGGYGVTGTLTASNWADQSGNGRDLAQGTAGNQPIYLPYSGTSYAWLPGVSGNYFSTPDAPENSITGDIDVRAYVACNNWTLGTDQTLASKYKPTGNQLSWYFNVAATTGRLVLGCSSNGSAITSTATSSVAPTISNGSALWVRATFATATGKVNFYTSSDGSTWSALGTEQSGTAGAIFDGTAPIEVGSATGGTVNTFAAKIYRAQIYNGINGTLAVDLNPSDFTETSTNGATAVSSTTGETWTLNSTGAKPAQVVKSASLLANGQNSSMATAGFTLTGASSIYIVGRANAWLGNTYLLDGVSINTLAIGQFNVTPSVDFIGLVCSNSDLALGTKGIITAIENGASSLITINAGSASTGNHATGAKGGLTLFGYGGVGGGSANNGQWQVWEIIAFPAAHTAAQRTSVVNWLNWVHHCY